MKQTLLSLLLLFVGMASGFAQSKRIASMEIEIATRHYTSTFSYDDQERVRYNLLRIAMVALPRTIRLTIHILETISTSLMHIIAERIRMLIILQTVKFKLERYSWM